MNFSFSAEQEQLRDSARRFLADRVSIGALRAMHDRGEHTDRALWLDMANLGWLATAIPESLGGTGLGSLELCVLAEECGRTLAPAPFVRGVGIFGEMLRRFGSDAQKARYLPGLARGGLLPCVALSEGPGASDPAGARSSLAGGRLEGVKLPVADGADADIALVACRDESGRMVLAIAEIAQPGVRVEPVGSIDPFQGYARLRFDGAAAERLGSPEGPRIDALLDIAAVMMSFEQVGGAKACLEMARRYALERHVFARPIGSFQTIKHRLADMAVKIELAESNAWYAAWALSNDALALPLAAATARLAASDCYEFAARENMQIHGGIGYTWDADCHPWYTRSRALAVALGDTTSWSERLMAALERDAEVE